ncbi:thiamine phosphate synthase [Ktedonobacter sp. SOSP1-85]|uniref:thiamine phosphate synthase n=1 Tax=Ktedonobacter sp. SOSP1-85 TaxID=2778367 RepID=UPI0035B31B14
MGFSAHSENSPRRELTRRLRLQVLTDRGWARGRDMALLASAALEGGTTAIQLRDKVASTRVLIEEGQRLRVLTCQHGALLIVNDRLDIALAVEADGLHVGQEDMPISLARRLLGPAYLLGVSVATLAEAEQAISEGADYLSVSPVFSTQSKVDAGEGVGLPVLGEIARQSPLPVIAIGGIGEENIASIIRAGACGVAVISAVMGAEDVTTAARRLHMAIEAAF